MSYAPQHEPSMTVGMTLLKPADARKGRVTVALGAWEAISAGLTTGSHAAALMPTSIPIAGLTLPDRDVRRIRGRGREQQRRDTCEGREAVALCTYRDGKRAHAGRDLEDLLFAAQTRDAACAPARIFRQWEARERAPSGVGVIQLGVYPRTRGSSIVSRRHDCGELTKPPRRARD